MTFGWPITEPPAAARVEVGSTKALILNRSQLWHYLLAASRHVADAELRVHSQRTIVSDFVRDGRLAAAIEARELLKTFEGAHALYIADRDLLQVLLREATRRAGVWSVNATI